LLQNCQIKTELPVVCQFIFFFFIFHIVSFILLRYGGGDVAAGPAEIRTAGAFRFIAKTDAGHSNGH